jgi:hypothetical protein
MPTDIVQPHRAGSRPSLAFGILVVERARTELLRCDDRRAVPVVDDAFPVPFAGVGGGAEQDRDTQLLAYLWRIHAALEASVGPDLPIVLAGDVSALTAYRDLFADPRRIVASLPGQGTMSARALHHQALRALGRAIPARRR